MIRKILFQVHWIVGITAGIVLAIVGTTGAILSFESAVLNSLNAGVRTVPRQSSQSLSAAQLIAKFRNDHPQRRLLSLTLSSDSTTAAKLSLVPLAEKPRTANEPPGRAPRGETRYLNPYSGDLIEGRDDRGQGFFSATRQLHRWLMLGGAGNQAVGRQIVGACTLLLLLLGVTGLYLRWPRNPLSWRAWLTFNVRLKGQSFLWHLHAVAAAWVLMFYLVMALTGLFWSYDWYRDGLYAITGTSRPAEAQGRERTRSEQGAPAAMGDGTKAEPQPALDIGLLWNGFDRYLENRGYSVVTLTLPHSGGDSVEWRYQDPHPAHQRAFNTLTMNAHSGEILKSERYAEKSFGAKLMASIFPLHSGSFFGAVGSTLYMLASMAMPLFAITGWMLYLGRRKRKYHMRSQLSASASLNSRTAASDENAT